MHGLTETQLLFGLPRRAAKTLCEMPTRNLLPLSTKYRSLLVVRAGNRLAVWERILIGNRCRTEKRQHEISYLPAMQTIVTDWL